MKGNLIRNYYFFFLTKQNIFLIKITLLFGKSLFLCENVKYEKHSVIINTMLY